MSVWDGSIPAVPLSVLREFLGLLVSFKTLLRYATSLAAGGSNTFVRGNGGQDHDPFGFVDVPRWCWKSRYSWEQRLKPRRLGEKEDGKRKGRLLS